MRRHLILLLFSCCAFIARGQTNVTCWFDDAYTEQETIRMDGNAWSSSMDVRRVKDGIHVLHMQIDGEKPSPVTSQLFVKLPEQAVQADYDGTVRYWIDDDTTNTVSTSLGNGLFTIDVTALKHGIHTLHVMVGSNASSIMSKLFVRLAVQPEIAEYDGTVRYWVDNDFAGYVREPLGDGLITIDVSALKDGIHTLHVAAGERASSVTSQLFMKLAERATPSFTKYEYWVNDGEMLGGGELPGGQSTVQLISLLPVVERPFRSNSFHFAMENAVPVLYARNDIRLRFHLADSHYADTVCQYTDYRTKQAITDILPIAPNSTKTFGRPSQNNIQWLSFEAEPGDTVAFKSSQATCIQVFSPSAEEVYSAEGSTSVKQGGCHVWESGTYYIAVHDVTGSGSTVKLDYMHMDKYDVVDWDVRTVGNGGCSTITFKGNGFRDLYAVDLVASGNTIRSVDVSHDSDAETAVTFDFTDAPLGKYDAVFHFTEEDKHVANVVTVEEAVDIELATSVTFPSTFLRGTSTTYTVKITNKGNMTAYTVPIHIFLSAPSHSAINKIHIDGLDLPSLFVGVECDSLTTDDLLWMKETEERVAESHYFIRIDTVDAIGNEQSTWSADFFTLIAPSSTKTFSITLETTATVTSNITVPQRGIPLSFASYSSYANSRKARLKFTREDYCCVREQWECYVNILADVTSFANMVTSNAPGTPLSVGLGVADCVVSAISQIVSATGTVLCDGGEKPQETIWDKTQAILGGISIAGTLSSCASKIIPVKKLKSLLKAIGDIAGNDFLTAFGFGVDVGNCINAFITPNPNCPPNSSHKGGSSTPAPPADPNDIFGYLSEAGSRFIADSVARVNYTIEFENDTTLANASAHTIAIRDTLDSRYFDLTEFVPTGVRIGSHEVFLDESDVTTENDVTSFVKTIDMRPEINAIAQAEGKFSQKKGIAEWTFTSLDPMTMEPTDDLMQGILPVNYDGMSGIGEVMFEIGVKQGKADGSEIRNRAAIVFDYEDPILTPTWTNIVDAVAPTSSVTDVSMLNDSTLRIAAQGLDSRSGVWKYEWYVQHGENAPWWKEGETEEYFFDFHLYEGFNYGFCVVATDSAGNVERKELTRERAFKSYGKDSEDGIDEVPAAAAAGNPSIYDLSGRRHDEPQEDNVNIINRRKVLFQRRKR